MNKQNPATKKPLYKVEDGVYPACLVGYELYGHGADERCRFTFELYGEDGKPLREKNIEAGGRRTRNENLKTVTLIRVTSRSMQEGSHRRNILSAFKECRDILGVMPLESLGPDELIGSSCTVLVMNEKNRNGVVYPNIMQVFADDISFKALKALSKKTNAA